MKVERIGVVLPDLGGGGVQRVLLNLAQGFAAHGRRVTLFTLDGGRPVSAVPADVEHVDLAALGWLTAVGRLRAGVRERRIDALVGGITRANLAVLAAARGPRHRVRTVLTKHLPVDMLSERPLRQRALATVVRSTYRHADAVVAVSEGTHGSLVDVGLPPQRLHRIANPVLGDDLDERCRAPVAHPWFEPSAPPVVLGVGRLTAQKDFATLVRAFALVRSNRDVRLAILGDGEQRVALQELAAREGLDEAVWFAGQVPDALPYMARAAVVAVSSRWEGLPTVIVEALAAGAAVVSTDCRTGPRELLEDGALGALVPVGGVEALAAAIERALTHKPVVPRERLARYEIAHASATYLELLEGL